MCCCLFFLMCVCVCACIPACAAPFPRGCEGGGGGGGGGEGVSEEMFLDTFSPCWTASVCLLPCLFSSERRQRRQRRRPHLCRQSSSKADYKSPAPFSLIKPVAACKQSRLLALISRRLAFLPNLFPPGHRRSASPRRIVFRSSCLRVAR